MELRKSSYTISVKLEAEDDKYMLIHGYTGAMDIVTGKVVDYFKNYPLFSKKEFPFSKPTLELLISRGYITTKTVDEEREHVRRFAALLHNSAKNSLKQYMFLVSYDCNFRCSYCYEGGISKQGKQWTKKTFTNELIDKAYETMSEIEPNQKMHNSYITLYGGEPFLKENIEIVNYIIKRGVELGYSFHAITNGHDLDHYEQILATGAIKHLQITLDGGKEMHETRRYHYQTGKSFDKIFNNIGLALNNNISISVRFNADYKNFEEIKKLRALFEKAGYSQKGYFNFHTAILRGGENDIAKGGSLQQSQLQKENIKNEKENILYLSREDFNKLHKEAGFDVGHQDYGLYENLFSTIKYGNFLRFHSIFCGVQTNLYIFDPYGDIYNCWETVGVKSHILGNYKEKLTWTEEIKNWQERNIGTTPKCSVCKYALLCGGGCIAKALRRGGKLGFKASYCDNYEDIVNLTVNRIYKDWKHQSIQ
ncbi:MAG: SPASM domain-containing protein [Bacteroidales bacterium]|jgi:uncharacterized protein|nr:SPASM domain-containing protein [Bacteroidales bacterium]